MEVLDLSIQFAAQGVIPVRKVCEGPKVRSRIPSQGTKESMVEIFAGPPDDVLRDCVSIVCYVQREPNNELEMEATLMSNVDLFTNIF